MAKDAGRAVTIADVVKIQLDYFYRDPAIVAKAYIAIGDPGILREAKRRGMDLGPHLAREFEEHEKLWKRLTRR